MGKGSANSFWGQVVCCYNLTDEVLLHVDLHGLWNVLAIWDRDFLYAKPTKAKWRRCASWEAFIHSQKESGRSHQSDLLQLKGLSSATHTRKYMTHTTAALSLAWAAALRASALEPPAVSKPKSHEMSKAHSFHENWLRNLPDLKHFTAFPDCLSLRFLGGSGCPLRPSHVLCKVNARSRGLYQCFMAGAVTAPVGSIVSVS